MSKQVKINRIHSLLNDINKRNDVATFTRCFYSDGSTFYSDQKHNIKTTEKEIDTYFEQERINQNADKIFKIIIVDKTIKNEENTNTLLRK